MPIPSYKQLHIKKSNRLDIFDQLNFHQFGQVPYVFSIDHLENEIEALANIEDYFYEYKLSHYPYPTYIVSNIQNYQGPLLLVQTIEQCPRFYKQKVKQLNVKENKILQKIYLKQKNMNNLKDFDYQPAIEEYAKGHKKLSHLNHAKKFYDQLNNILEKFYDQKEK